MMNLNPKKMQALMKQMGMSQEDIEASRVTIEKLDGSKIIIENPSVAKIKIQGQESFQISGDVSEVEEGFLDEDIQAVMDKAGVDEKKAKKALEESGGDIADAILSLS